MGQSIRERVLYFLAEMKLRLVTAILGLSACGVLTGCGEPAAVDLKDSKVVRISLENFRYSPQNMVVDGGHKLTFEVVNRGKVASNMHVTDWNGRHVFWVLMMQPGEKKVVSHHLARGKYRIQSTAANHGQLGMYGAITVR